MHDVAIKEFPPSAELKDFVQAYWTGEFNAQSLSGWSQKVIPNGYVEVIIHLGDDHCTLFGPDQWNSSPSYTVLGVYTKPYVVRFFKPVSVFGIRFNPEALHQIFGVPAASLPDSFEAAGEVLGSAFHHLCDLVRTSNATYNRISLTEEFLKRSLGDHYRSYDYVACAARVIRQQSARKMEHINAIVPISPRQLQREFKSKMGLTPKAYLRLARMNAIQRYLQGTDRPDLTRLTYSYGFSDPSHLVKEFRMMTGVPPSHFIETRNEFIVNPSMVT